MTCQLVQVVLASAVIVQTAAAFGKAPIHMQPVLNVARRASPVVALGHNFGGISDERTEPVGVKTAGNAYSRAKVVSSGSSGAAALSQSEPLANSNWGTLRTATYTVAAVFALQTSLASIIAIELSLVGHVQTAAAALRRVHVALPFVVAAAARQRCGSLLD